MAEGRDIPIVEQGKKPGKRPPWWKRLWARTGVGDKTLWDLLQLLVVPLALAVIGFWFTAQQDARQQQIEDRRAQEAQKIENQRAEAERELAEQRVQDEALQAYLDQMSSLLLEKDLRALKEDSEVRTLARARTLTVLRRLDPSRKTAVIQFLAEAELVQRVIRYRSEGRGPIISLGGADLRGANLDVSGIYLSGANLSKVDLRGANLSGTTSLEDANLSEADLRGANLNYALLDDANLSRTDLSGNDLSEAYLRRADLNNADLSGAKLRSAHLKAAFLLGADLSGADLSRARLEDANLEDANLEDADLSRADLSRANLSRANLEDVDLNGADLIEAKLRETDLEDANLSPAELKGADLRDAYLAGANLRYARGVTKETLEKHTGSLEALRGATMPTDQYVTYQFEPAFAFVMIEDWETVPPETTDQVGIQAGSEGGELAFTNPSHVYDPSSPCGAKKEVPAPQNADEWVSWFQRHPNLDTSKPVPVSVGGASGMRIDVTASSMPEQTYLRGLGYLCVPEIASKQPYLTLYPSGATPGCVGLGNKPCKSAILSFERFKDRFVIVDVGGETVVINVSAPEDKFDAFLPKAQKVLDTVEWRDE